MPTRDPRIDAYIAKAQPFAQPILAHIRAVVHEACPDVVETMKWSFPHFTYRGHILCGMSAFKAHCALGFWRSRDLVGAATKNAEAMGDYGRIASVADLPSATKLKAVVRRAMRLEDTGAPRVPRKKSAPKPPPVTPRALASALAKVPRAKAAWAAFAPSHRREYIEWITEAKTAPTRERRIAQTVEWVADGKGRNWKYAR